MRFTVLTLFPDLVEAVLGSSILGRARAAGVLDLRAVDIRDHAEGKHRIVDFPPYGGGGGMLMKPGPVCAAIDAAAGPPGDPRRARVWHLSPRGGTWTQAHAVRAAQDLVADPERGLVLLCGHYEGIDQRVIDSRVDAEYSLGDFVLTGGELPALAILDSIARLLPGVLGNEDSAAKDSFSDFLLEGPHYTRPEVFEGRAVPEVLLSGNHAAIEKWRRQQAIATTRARRPDLLAKWEEAHAEELAEERHREQRRAARRRRKAPPPADG